MKRQLLLFLALAGCYPDSDKISFWSDSSDPADNVRVRRGEKLDYYDGER